MPSVWPRLTRDPMIRAWPVVAAALALPYLFLPSASPEEREVYAGFVAEAALLAFALAAFVRAARENEGASARFHRVVVLGLSLWLAQKALSYTPGLPGAPWMVLVEDSLLVGFYVCLATAALLRPDLPGQRVRLDSKRLLDVAGTVIFALGLLAYFSLVPLLYKPALLESFLPSMALLCALDGLLVLRFGWVFRNCADPRWRAVHGLLCATAVLWFATDLLEALTYGGIVPAFATGSGFDFVWWVPFAPLTAAARAGRQARPDGEPEGAPAEAASVPTSGAWADALVGYAAAFPLLHFVLYATGLLDPATRAPRERLGLLVLVVLAGLAVAYQKLLLAENRRLEEVRLRAVRAEHRAYHDALTGLPNRYLLFDRLETALARARRLESRLAVLFLDLDRFKVVNDTLGHSQGDRLLRLVAERLSRQVRKGDTLARLGGDEFTVLLETLPDPADALTVARHLREVLREPFLLDGRELYVTTSTGIAVHPEDGMDAEALLKSSDIAMYRAKQRGGDAFQLYQAEMNARAEERLSLESSLRRALGAGQFALQYQPIVLTATRRPIGFEVLLRWRHPERGVLLPADFIELAELTGVILEVGPWVLREACREAAGWQGEMADALVAVNLSARQFLDARLVEQVEAALRESGLPAHRLELEITESVAMQSSESASATLDALRALGARLSIDDFGTGYSSLGYLKRLPLDTLKVDRSFVRDLERAPEDATIAATILAMARTLGLRVVAEGVETEGQLEVLRRLQCEFAQGYLFGPPRWPETLRRSPQAVPS